MVDQEKIDQALQDFQGGNTSGSPTDEGGAQAGEGTQEGDSSADEGTEQTGQEGAAPPGGAGGEEEGGSEEGGEAGDGDEKPPYDQDPKWKAARAAEKRFNEILENHGFKSAEDLVEALKSGQSLREIVGDRDAEQMKSDADEMAKTRAFWAQKEAEKRESEESPEETIDRLKREKKEMYDHFTRESEDRQAVEESQRVLKDFDTSMTSLVSADTDLANVQEIALLALGVGNPATEVDPTDQKASKQAATQVIAKLKEALAARDQAVIDAYVKGKSTITPIKETDASTGSPNVKHEREPLKADTTLDDASALAKQRALEMIAKEDAANA